LYFLHQVIVTGTFLGSFLRHLSKAAQSQVAKATAAGDEALNNIRTVRAFAMEDREYEVYADELSKATKMNETLGLGIGMFQERDLPMFKNYS
jgi:ATP-binding cassette subfamily B (MDR/TAP) protein 8